jgi:hypothetical protein
MKGILRHQELEANVKPFTEILYATIIALMFKLLAAQILISSFIIRLGRI